MAYSEQSGLIRQADFNGNGRFEPQNSRIEINLQHLSMVKKQTTNLLEIEHFQLFPVRNLGLQTSALPHLDWRPGRCGCHQWSPGRPLRTPSPRSRATRTQESRCGTRRWPSQLRGCGCWRSYGLWGPLSGSSLTVWCRLLQRNLLDGSPWATTSECRLGYGDPKGYDLLNAPDLLQSFTSTNQTGSMQSGAPHCPKVEDSHQSLTIQYVDKVGS